MKSIVKILVLGIILLSSFQSKAQKISSKEINDMKYMLEEEKVARDVYDFLGEKWGVRVFDNIKRSEQRHIEMMQNLLEVNKVAYQLNNQNGRFYNKDLQKMYNDLIARGSISLKEAFEVGKLIEETDIKDLEEAIKNTDSSFSKQVYSYLLRASKNHLRAFNRQLSKY
ncbi:DUF2202 domain-containing protein [Tenacibaculum sp. IB213877]|uniref:DUF2202 domain-containing protein n=1 Tax=Tenacibaculum sp. IB213877 TaxID=3097351 RepID=UPI002A5A4EC2|nr:DUF2202 domain-containing protein [Tenacibaculum sp. IB213877]MDY0780982.1 DUF2202 domain-containing protein [Tenacibaculum sp. IB213877]